MSNLASTPMLSFETNQNSLMNVFQNRFRGLMKSVAKRARHTATLQEHARPRVVYNFSQEAEEGRRAIAHDLNPYKNRENKLVTEKKFGPDYFNRELRAQPKHTEAGWLEVAVYDNPRHPLQNLRTQADRMRIPRCTDRGLDEVGIHRVPPVGVKEYKSWSIH